GTARDGRPSSGLPAATATPSATGHDARRPRATLPTRSGGEPGHRGQSRRRDLGWLHGPRCAFAPLRYYAAPSSFARSRTNFVSAILSILPEPSSGSLSRTSSSVGTIISEAPWARAKAQRSERLASALLVTSTRRSPLRASGTVATPDMASGHSSEASASTAASEIISPPILAKRLARPWL